MLDTYKIMPRLVVGQDFCIDAPLTYTKEEMMQSGVYKISFEGSRGFYIGSTSNSFIKRFRRHCGSLVRGVHSNFVLNKAFIKYKGKVIFEILQSFPNDGIKNRDTIISCEQRFLDSFGFSNLYNLARAACGGASENSCRIFSDSDVLKIFSLRSEGITCFEISDIMKCSHATVCSIISRKSYLDVSIPQTLLDLVSDLPRVKNGGIKHSQAFDMVKLRADGKTYHSISKKFNISNNSVFRNIKNFKPRNYHEKITLKKALDSKISCISQHNIDAVKSLYAEGHSKSEISRRISIGRQTVSYILDPDLKSKHREIRKSKRAAEKKLLAQNN